MSNSPTIKDLWNPTEEELNGLIESAKPFDDGFVDRLFEFGHGLYAPAWLNVVFQLRDLLEKVLEPKYLERFELLSDCLDEYVNEYIE